MRYEKSYYFCGVQKKERDMKKVSLTEAEYDLIMSIRNYRRSYPNGYPEFRWYVEGLFADLMDGDEEGK